MEERKEGHREREAGGGGGGGGACDLCPLLGMSLMPE